MTTKKAKLLKGLFTGIVFGFLLQKGGVTQYNVIVGQLRLADFTVVKIIITAIITGMVGIYFLRDKNLIELSPKNKSPLQVIPGGLLFGIGFAVLGYCPGTIVGAMGQGSLDALLPGLAGILIGSALYANFHQKFSGLINKGKFSQATLPEKLNINHWKIIFPVVAILISVLIIIELYGF